MTKIVDQLIKLVEEKKKGGNELFEGDEGKINLQIAGIKLPRDERKQLIKM